MRRVFVLGVAASFAGGDLGRQLDRACTVAVRRVIVKGVAASFARGDLFFVHLQRSVFRGVCTGTLATTIVSSIRKITACYDDFEAGERILAAAGSPCDRSLCGFEAASASK